MYNLSNSIKMNSSKGYIYIRTHPSYDVYDACKLGKTKNIPDRDSQYATCEIERGNFYPVFEVSIEHMDDIENSLQEEFSIFHIYYNAGTEFYKKEIINKIEPFMKDNGYPYKKMSEEEIDQLVRCNRIRNTNKQEMSYIPRKYQQEIIKKSITHFQKYDKGLLVLTCGVGKTLISCWIAQQMKSQSIVIGVPNMLLLEQWKEKCTVLFEQAPILVVSGAIETEHIVKFLEKNRDCCIVITTYASSYKVFTASQALNFTFGMKIYDEVHHLTSTNMHLNNNNKTYTQMLKIPSTKQLSLTATIKLLESNDSTKDVVISNDNVEYFGEIIEQKTLSWAIRENIVCDYVIQTIFTEEERLEHYFSRFFIREEKDKRLFLSAYATLKSIHDGHSHHLLVYSNNKENSLKIIRYIQLLLENEYFHILELYFSEYHSDMNIKQRKGILRAFQDSKFGIIACVYCLGEGWDFPLLDGVVFSENMTSVIRILQSVLRPGRKNKNEIYKKTKIILPVLHTDDWLENQDNCDLKKVKQVIYQMGLEDELITQKIKVFRIDVEQRTPTEKREKEKQEITDDFGEYDEQLTNALRLKTIKRFTVGTSYESAKQILKDKHIKTKTQYYELCEKDHRLPKNPENAFKGKFVDWIDYLGIERVYYDLETCKLKVSDYLLLHPHIKQQLLDLSIISQELCNIDALFPPHGLWVEYYNVKSLEEIIVFTNKKKRKGAVM